MTQPPALRPLEEMIERWKKATIDLADGVKDSPSFDLKRMIKERCEAVTICADELASALPEIKRLLGERVAAMRGACAQTSCNGCKVDVPTYGSRGLLWHHTKDGKEDAICAARGIWEVTDEQADKWLAEHDRELTKRVLESACKAQCWMCRQNAWVDLDSETLRWRHKDGSVCGAHAVRALGGSE